MSSVDIVIPCYNYARFLRQSVESALFQEGVDVRVLIIDDCSSDESEEVGRALQAQDSRVTFRRHGENRGHIATYNEGLLGWASADYSVLLSADDALAPGALARAAQIMDRHPDVGMTCGVGRIIWNDERCPVTDESSSTEYRIVPGPDFLHRCFEKGNIVCTPTAVVRTELQQRLGGYRADLPHSGDMEMWMRFAVHNPVAATRAIQAYYRKHSANMSHHYYRQTFGDKEEVIKAYDAILTQWGTRFPDAGSWRGLMLRRLGEGAFWDGSRAFDHGDLEGCRACLEFAARLYPEIRTSRYWWRLRVKRLVGPALCRSVRPLLNLVRGNRDAEPEEGAAQGQEPGCWPVSPAC